MLAYKPELPRPLTPHTLFVPASPSRPILKRHNSAKHTSPIHLTSTKESNHLHCDQRKSWCPTLSDQTSQAISSNVPRQKLEVGTDQTVHLQLSQPEHKSSDFSSDFTSDLACSAAIRPNETTDPIKNNIHFEEVQSASCSLPDHTLTICVSRSPSLQSASVAQSECDSIFERTSFSATPPLPPISLPQNPTKTPSTATRQVIPDTDSDDDETPLALSKHAPAFWSIYRAFPGGVTIPLQTHYTSVHSSSWPTTTAEALNTQRMRPVDYPVAYMKGEEHSRFRKGREKVWLRRRVFTQSHLFQQGTPF
ncbi:hypothetical protein BJ741DRAFT_595254 [Chytriomyces cf. hyalinus JEL632]|nr:hypothetical protein BJ741DRAFT_595254 [Chytriomyces cf. hyalinus JEL632]